jgi:hypothetical protein
MLIKILKNAKLVERQFEAHMGYDGKDENEVHPNGKHQLCLWMQSMSMLKRDENMVKLEATFPLIQMITYE